MEDDSILSRRGRAPDRVVRYGPHPDQTIEFRGDPAHPLVAIVHGGFWRPAMDRAHTGAQADALADAGFRVATLEYRRVPGDPDATVSDLRAALEELGGPGSPPVVVGHSAGGHLALLLAATGAPIRAAVGLGPVASLRRADALRLGDDAVGAFLGTGASARRDLDPAELPHPGVPVAILHGDADAIVPLGVSEDYVAAHPAASLEVLAGAGHFPVIDPDAPEFARVVAAIRAAHGGARAQSAAGGAGDA